MEERTYEASLSESDWNLVIEILMAEERRNRSQAEKTERSGYGTASTQVKADKWRKRADHITEITAAISANAI